METINRPLVCKAVRTVGVIKPQFNAQIKGFSPPQLTVLGTGFWLKEAKTFVTCEHVVSSLLQGSIEQTGMLVVGGNGVDYQKAIVNIFDSLHDLAILSIEANKDFIDSQINTGLSLAERHVEISEGVAYAGFPFGNALLNSRHSPTYSEGIVGSDMLDDNIPKTIQISGPIAGGYSGAPIVLRTEPDKVIAVIANSPSQQAGQANIFRGISWRHVKALCELRLS